MINRLNAQTNEDLLTDRHSERQQKRAALTRLSQTRVDHYHHTRICTYDNISEILNKMRKYVNLWLKLRIYYLKQK
jgi:hypothetical protein